MPYFVHRFSRSLKDSLNILLVKAKYFVHGLQFHIEINS